MSTKKANKRIARKRALRTSKARDDAATRDSMKAARRGYGLGIGK